MSGAWALRMMMMMMEMMMMVMMIGVKQDQSSRANHDPWNLRNEKARRLQGRPN